MKGALLYGDLGFEERDAPKIIKPMDAIFRISATCVAGPTCSPTAALAGSPSPHRWGTEYCGIVEEVGSAVTSIKPGRGGG
jgi:threonine dehydrogenase-like Zn-dependent dehydrogenase